MTKGKSKIHFHTLYKFSLKNKVLLKNHLLNLFASEKRVIDEINFIDPLQICNTDNQHYFREIEIVGDSTFIHGYGHSCFWICLQAAEAKKEKS